GTSIYTISNQKPRKWDILAAKSASAERLCLPSAARERSARKTANGISSTSFPCSSIPNLLLPCGHLQFCRYGSPESCQFCDSSPGLWQSVFRLALTPLGLHRYTLNAPRIRP